MSDAARTLIYKRTASGDDTPIGYVNLAGDICKLRWDESTVVGRWDKPVSYTHLTLPTSDLV